MLLILAIICSIGVSLSLQNLISSYDDRCILHARIHFETEQERETYFYQRFKNVKLSETKADDSSVVVANSYGKLKDHFNESYAAFLNKDLDAEYPADQIRFLVDRKCIPMI